MKDEKQAISPSNLASKGSILAKHLYFDQQVAPEYDLTTEIGRSHFLTNECEINITTTQTRAAARELEKPLEETGEYRYCRFVLERR